MSPAGRAVTGGAKDAQGGDLTQKFGGQGKLLDG